MPPRPGATMGRDQEPVFEEDVAEEATGYAAEVPGLRHSSPGAAIRRTARGARGLMVELGGTWVLLAGIRDGAYLNG